MPGAAGALMTGSNYHGQLNHPLLAIILLLIWACVIFYIFYKFDKDYK